MQANFRTERSMLRTASRLVLMAGVVVAGAAGAIALRADLLIGYGFSKAFETRTDSLAPFQVAKDDSPDDVSAKAEVGDEAYWHRRGNAFTRPVVRAYWHQRGDANARPVAVRSGPLFVGQLTVVEFPEEGIKRHLEVVAIDFVGTPLVSVSVSHGPPAVRLMRVTYRVLYLDGSGKAEPVHIWFQLESEPGPAGHRQARTSGT
jgi:hypothetical protein